MTHTSATCNPLTDLFSCSWTGSSYLDVFFVLLAFPLILLLIPLSFVLVVVFSVIAVLPFMLVDSLVTLLFFPTISQLIGNETGDANTYFDMTCWFINFVKTAANLTSTIGDTRYSFVYSLFMSVNTSACQGDYVKFLTFYQGYSA